MGVGERQWDKPEGKEVQPAKTLWDWLQLLIVPAILILVVTLWNSSQTARDNRHADQARQDTTLDTYFKQMSDLMLNNKLRASADGSAVRAVATSVTNSTLRRLDGERQSEVVRFESETGAKLSSLNLEGQNLTRAQLEFAYLEHAVLGFANLRRANLLGAHLRWADLRGADLEGAELGGADLRGVNLEGANLRDADLDGANFKGANLIDANLKGANQGARISLRGAALSDTTCPNGEVSNFAC